VHGISRIFFGSNCLAVVFVLDLVFCSGIVLGCVLAGFRVVFYVVWGDLLVVYWFFWGRCECFFLFFWLFFRGY